MIEWTMKCYKCGKRSYDDNACLDEETGLPCWRSPAEEDLCSACASRRPPMATAPTSPQRRRREKLRNSA